MKSALPWLQVRVRQEIKYGAWSVTGKSGICRKTRCREERKMKTRYIRDLNRHYYVLSLEELPAEDFQLPMLLENRIAGIPEHFEQTADGVRELCYEVTSMQPLKDYYESEKLSVDEILELFLYLNKVIGELDRFLLRGSSLMLDPESIFRRTDNREILFCYDPCSTTKVSDGLNCLSRFILDHIDYENREALELAYSLFQESMKESVSLQDFTRLALSAANRNAQKQAGAPEDEEYLPEQAPRQKETGRPEEDYPAGNALPESEGKEFRKERSRGWKQKQEEKGSPGKWRQKQEEEEVLPKRWRLKQEEEVVLPRRWKEKQEERALSGRRKQKQGEAVFPDAERNKGTGAGRKAPGAVPDLSGNSTLQNPETPASGRTPRKRLSGKLAVIAVFSGIVNGGMVLSGCSAALILMLQYRVSPVAASGGIGTAVIALSLLEWRAVSGIAFRMSGSP